MRGSFSLFRAWKASNQPSNTTDGASRPDALSMPRQLLLLASHQGSDSEEFLLSESGGLISSPPQKRDEGFEHAIHNGVYTSRDFMPLSAKSVR